MLAYCLVLSKHLKYIFWIDTISKLSENKILMTIVKSNIRSLLPNQAYVFGEEEDIFIQESLLGVPWNSLVFPISDAREA